MVSKQLSYAGYPVRILGRTYNQVTSKNLPFRQKLKCKNQSISQNPISREYDLSELYLCRVALVNQEAADELTGRRVMEYPPLEI